ncbi:MAG: hypothetical protein GY765_08985, partial [bacterium]|nr:hypothetical protein [bacterium]
YMIPSFFILIETIPLSPIGKIDRKALSNLDISSIISHSDFEPPNGPMEDVLVAIWAEVLELDKELIGCRHNFFELGGHSISAIALTANIHKELDIKIKLGNFFKYPTIRELSNFLQGVASNVYAGIEPVEKREYYPLSPAQKRMYFLQQMDTNSVAYNMPQEIPLGKEIDKERLETVLKNLLQRHE